MDVCRGFALAAPAVVFGLIVIWAAIADVSRLWRVAAVLVVCGLMLPTIAYPLALFGLISGGSVVVATMLIRALTAWRKAHTAWRFGVRELLLWTVVACATAGIVAYVVNNSPPHHWHKFAASAALYGLSLLVVMPSVAIAARRWWLNLLWGVVLAAFTAGYAVAWQWINWFEFDPFWLLTGNYWPPTVTEYFAVWQIGMLTLLLSVWSLRRAQIFRSSFDNVAANSIVGNQKRRTAWWTAALAVLAAPLLLTALWMYFRVAQPAPPFPSGPSGENHYRELIATASSLQSADVVDVDALSMKECELLLAVDAPILRKLEQMLDKPSFVPMASSRQAWEDDLHSIGMSRNVVRAYLVEGRFRMEHGRAAQAADGYMYGLNFAKQTSRGGLIVDELVAGAAESSALEELWSIRQSLTSAHCRQIARQLEQHDASREPWAIIEQRDRAWSLRVYGWEWILHEILSIDPLDYESICDSATRRVAIMRLMAAEIAIAAFRADRGRCPDALSDLVPRYLTAVPKDPFDQRDLRFRRRGNTYILYSIGANLADDGGVVVGIRTPDELYAGDILLDAFELAQTESYLPEPTPTNDAPE